MHKIFIKAKKMPFVIKLCSFVLLLKYRAGRRDLRDAINDFYN